MTLLVSHFDISGKKERISELTNKSDKEIVTNTKYNSVSIILKSSLEVGTFITCAILLYYENITLTFFVAMTYYIFRFTWLIENITAFSRIYNQVSVSLQRINEILENKLYKDVKYGDKELNNCKGIIKFDKVEFAYPNEPNTLKGLTIEFKPNKKIAIVGKSGQGKTTIFNLLTRIFDTEKGTITVDGINIKDLTEKSLRDNIAIIRQEPFLFNRTIRENFEIVKSDIIDSTNFIKDKAKLSSVTIFEMYQLYDIDFELKENIYTIKIIYMGINTSGNKPLNYTSLKIKFDNINEGKIFKYFLEKYKNIYWQEFFEKTIPIHPPYIYQYHFFFTKLNSLSIFFLLKLISMRNLFPAIIDFFCLYFL